MGNLVTISSLLDNVWQRDYLQIAALGSNVVGVIPLPPAQYAQITANTAALVSSSLKLETDTGLAAVSDYVAALGNVINIGSAAAKLVPNPLAIAVGEVGTVVGSGLDIVGLAADTLNVLIQAIPDVISQYSGSVFANLSPEQQNNVTILSNVVAAATSLNGQSPNYAYFQSLLAGGPVAGGAGSGNFTTALTGAEVESALENGQSISGNLNRINVSSGVDISGNATLSANDGIDTVFITANKMSTWEKVVYDVENGLDSVEDWVSGATSTAGSAIGGFLSDIGSALIPSPNPGAVGQLGSASVVLTSDNAAAGVYDSAVVGATDSAGGGSPAISAVANITGTGGISATLTTIQGANSTTLVDLESGNQVTVAGTVDTSNLQPGQPVAVSTSAGTYHIDPATGDITDAGAVTAMIGGETVTLIGLGGSSPFALISNDNSVSTAGAVSSNCTLDQAREKAGRAAQKTRKTFAVLVSQYSAAAWVGLGQVQRRARA